MSKLSKLSYVALAALVLSFSHSLLNREVAEALFGNNSLVSKNVSNVIANGGAADPDVSYDGRYSVFTSSANNLVTGDTNGFIDVFLKDTLLGTVTLVSVSSSGTQANAGSQRPRISADGKKVVYSSDATNLVSNDTNGKTDIFLYTISSGTTEIISKDVNSILGNGSSVYPDLDGEGRFIVFQTSASNLSSISDTNAAEDILVKDTVSGTVTYVSSSDSGVVGNNNSADASISCDGRFIVFESSANNLVSSDTNGHKDVFLTDMLGTQTVSNVTSGANGSSESVDISCDGKYILYDSQATNQVSGDTNGVLDVFRFERTSTSKSRASIRENGSQSLQSTSGVAISADGKYVIFRGGGSTFLTSTTDTNDVDDLFFRDTTVNNMRLLSARSNGTVGNKASTQAKFNGNNKIVFLSQSTNISSDGGNVQGAIFSVFAGQPNTCMYQ